MAQEAFFDIGQFTLSADGESQLLFTVADGFKIMLVETRVVNRGSATRQFSLYHNRGILPIDEDADVIFPETDVVGGTPFIRNSSLTLDAGHRVYAQVSSVADVVIHMTGLLIGPLTQAIPLLIPRRYSKSFYVENPQAGDEFPITALSTSVILSEVYGETDVGTAVFNVERRVRGALLDPGTDVLSDDMTADADGQSGTTFDNDAEAAEDEELWLVVTSVDSSPELITGSVRYQDNV